MNKLILASLIVPAILFASSSAIAADAKALAKKSGCFGCHAIDKTIVGPAWKDVAKRYKNDPAARDKLVASVTKGSQGKWGTKIHMQSQKNVSKQDVVTLVDYILTL